MRTEIITGRTNIPNPLVLSEEQRFVASASPAEWARVAMELQYSAETLWAHEHQATAFSSNFGKGFGVRSMMSRSAFLLYGHALENLLKAIAVANKPTLISEGKLDSTIKSHKLVTLARTAGVTLGADEIALCKIASEADVHWGRYPIPLQASDLADEKIMEQKTMDSLNHLFIRLNNELATILSRGWDSGNGILIVSYEPRGRRFAVQYEIDVTPGATSDASGLTYEFGPTG